jgi:hypothetical protein
MDETPVKAQPVAVLAITQCLLKPDAIPVKAQLAQAGRVFMPLGRFFVPLSRNYEFRIFTNR